MPSPSRLGVPRHALLPSLAAAWAALAAAAALPGDATYTVGAAAGPARFEAPGQLEAVRQAQLAAQAAGRVTAVLVRSGDAVRGGQVLLRIDSPAARAAARSTGALADAQARQLESARADYARARQLHERQYLSDAALQRAAAQLAAIEAQGAAADAQAQAARAAAGWEELRAPYDGRVTAVLVAPGDLAQPGQPLVAMYAPGAMRLVADIPAAVGAQLATDQPLLATTPACARRTLEIHAWTLVPAVEAHSGSIAVRAELPDARDCVPGGMASVLLPMRGPAASIAIPLSAVVQRGELSAAYVVDAGGGVQLRQLRLGAPAGAMVEVLAGLDRGERVLADAAGYRPGRAGGAGRP